MGSGDSPELTVGLLEIRNPPGLIFQRGWLVDLRNPRSLDQHIPYVGITWRPFNLLTPSPILTNTWCLFSVNHQWRLWQWLLTGSVLQKVFIFVWHFYSCPHEVSVRIFIICGPRATLHQSRRLLLLSILRNCSQSFNIYTGGLKTPDGNTWVTFVIHEFKVRKGFR